MGNLRTRPMLLAIWLALVMTACAAPIEYSAPPPPPPPPVPMPVPMPPPAPPAYAQLPPPRDRGPTAALVRETVRFPQFPCRPPNPSDLLTISRPLVERNGQKRTLGAVEERLKQAFADAGYRQPRVYQTCGGFAMISSVERMRNDGAPFADPGRFVNLDQSISAIEDFSIEGVLRALFTVQPGRFRLTAFVVSDQTIAPTSERLSSDAARALTQGGAVSLPPRLAGEDFTPAHKIIALVYEFEKAPGTAEARMSQPPRFSASQNLERAGILPALRR